jgi:MFS family permease
MNRLESSRSPNRALLRIQSDRVLRTILMLAAVTAANYARVMVGPLQEAMRTSLGLSDNQIAILQGPVLALPIVIAAIPLGVLIDRLSRARLLLIFAAIDMIGSAVSSLAPSFTVLAASRGVVGLAATATPIATLSLLADLYAPTQRGRAAMLMSIGQSAGAAAAFALGGSLLTAVGRGGDGWRMVILWLALPLVPVTLSLLAMREPPRSAVLVEKPSLRSAFVELWQLRAVIIPLMMGVVMMEIALGAPGVWAASAFLRNFAVLPSHIGGIMGVAMLVSGFLGPAGGGMLADLCQKSGGATRTMSALTGVALLSIPAGLFASMPGIASASVLLVAFIALVSAGCVMGTTLFTVVIPNELRGLCIGILASVTVLFSIGLAPLAVSLLSSAMGGPAMIGRALVVVCVSTGVIGAAMFLLGRRQLGAERALQSNEPHV